MKQLQWENVRGINWRLLVKSIMIISMIVGLISIKNIVCSIIDNPSLIAERAKQAHHYALRKSKRNKSRYFRLKYGQTLGDIYDACDSWVGYDSIFYHSKQAVNNVVGMVRELTEI